MGRFVSLTYFPKIAGIFLRKPIGEKWLLFNIAVLSFTIRMMVLLLPFKYLAMFLGTQSEPGHNVNCSNPDRQVMVSVSRKIKHVSRFVPWDSNCLVQATVGKIILRKKKIASTVHFGVRKEENSMKAHAWLRVGHETLLGGEIADQFTEVSSFS